MNRKTLLILSLLGTLLLLPSLGMAEEAQETPVAIFTVNNVWMMLSAGLVFIMHLGFATLETGLTRAKNVINILFKNTFIVCIGILTYFIIGFSLMYSKEGNGFLAFSGFGLDFALPGSDAALKLETSAYNAGYTYWTDFLFQGMFAATAATIVSGAVAERVKLKSFMVFATIFVAISYPITGYWEWGGGWLNDRGFHDFAGSTMVHSVGGWGALVGILFLGPRLGKYGKDGKITPIPGSNMPLATIGVFLLWLGWFGFNGGSVLSADPGATSRVLVTTCLAAAAGCVGAIIVYGFISPKPDLSMALNGILAGLVGITASADCVSPVSSIIIGLIAGGLVVGSVIAFDKAKIDDPVGATSVHLVCGIWGTLAVGIFSFNPDYSFKEQLIGAAAIGAFTCAFAAVLFAIIKATMGLRVDPEEEMEGLDYGEHGAHGYMFEMAMSGVGKPAALEDSDSERPAAGADDKKLASSES